MDILTKDQILERTIKVFSVDLNARFTIKVIDYTGNKVAPEKYAYKIYYTDNVTKERRKTILYPNTVGFQYLK